MSTHVTEWLSRQGRRFKVIQHAPTYDAIEEAIVLGERSSDVIKTVVLDVGSGHALAVLPASEKVDLHLMQQATGDSHAHLANETELRRDFPEYELGAIPPVGSLLHLPVYVDPHVMTEPEVAFAATRTSSVKIRTEDLFGGEYVTVTPLARHYEDQGV